MNCDHVHRVLDAYVDNELDETTHDNLALHVQDCPACTALQADRLSIRKGLRSLPRHNAPDQLRKSILQALPADIRPPPRRQPRALSWWHAASLAATAAGAAFALGIWVATPLQMNDEREFAITRHVESLASGSPKIEVASSDGHTVKPWFAGKIDFSPPVPDLAEHGYALIGGRRDIVDGHPRAAIVYRIRKHDITLFVSRADQQKHVAMAVTTLRGFSVATWTRDGLGFIAVSDVNTSDLQKFAELLGV